MFLYLTKTLKNNKKEAFDSIYRVLIEQQINAANHFAKNTLSPYIRILYHTLKVVNEHHAENTSDMTLRAKQYTNTVRSVISNDVLF